MNTEEEGRRIEKRDSRKAICLVSGAALVTHLMNIYILNTITKGCISVL